MQNKSYILLYQDTKNIFEYRIYFYSCILQLDGRNNRYIKHVKYVHENL